jgi:importin-4
MQVLPVFLKSLPLKEDLEESMSVYGCICNLLLSSNPQVCLHLLYLLYLYGVYQVGSTLDQLFTALLLLSKHLTLNFLFSQILPLVPDVVHIFAQVVVSPDEPDNVKYLIGSAVTHLVSVYGQQMQPILAALPSSHASALAAFASKR